MSDLTPSQRAFLRRMEEQTLSGDPEIAHAEADEILGAVIRTHVDEPFAGRLLSAYERVDKWFA